jgi:hypothetical protein
MELKTTFRRCCDEWIEFKSLKGNVGNITIIIFSDSGIINGYSQGISCFWSS